MVTLIFAMILCFMGCEHAANSGENKGSITFADIEGTWVAGEPYDFDEDDNGIILGKVQDTARFYEENDELFCESYCNFLYVTERGLLDGKDLGTKHYYQNYKINSILYDENTFTFTFDNSINEEETMSAQLSTDKQTLTFIEIPEFCFNKVDPNAPLFENLLTFADIEGTWSDEPSDYTIFDEPTNQWSEVLGQIKNTFVFNKQNGTLDAICKSELISITEEGIKEGLKIGLLGDPIKINSIIYRQDSFSVIHTTTTDEDILTFWITEDENILKVKFDFYNPDSVEYYTKQK